MGYYEDIIKEKKNRVYQPLWSREKMKEFNEYAHRPNPEDSMHKLQVLKPVVEAFRDKGMTRHQVAMRLKQEKDISETLAQQCVDAWY